MSADDRPVPAKFGFSRWQRRRPYLGVLAIAGSAALALPLAGAGGVLGAPNTSTTIDITLDTSATTTTTAVVTTSSSTSTTTTTTTSTTALATTTTALATTTTALATTTSFTYPIVVEPVPDLAIPDRVSVTPDIAQPGQTITVAGHCAALGVEGYIDVVGADGRRVIIDDSGVGAAIAGDGSSDFSESFVLPRVFHSASTRSKHTVAASPQRLGSPMCTRLNGDRIYRSSQPHQRPSP